MAHRSAKLILIAPLVAVAVALVALLALVTSPSVVAGNPCFHGFDIPGSSEAADTEITLAPCAFGPTVAHVPEGATVTFFNSSDFNHLITGANAEWGSRDVELEPGQRVSYRFDRPGTYPYACALHAGMSGAIVVAEVASVRATAGPEAAAPTAAVKGDPPVQADTAAGAVSIAGSAAGGVLLGAAGLWFATRRRTG